MFIYHAPYLAPVFQNLLIQFILLITFIFYIVYVFIFLTLIPQKSTKRVDNPLTENFELWLIIPALNEESVIQRTIERLSLELSQLPKTISGKILVVDDGSEDNTYALSKALTTTIKTTPDIMQTGKGAVLNYGVEYIRQHRNRTLDEQHTIVGIIDADGFMPSNDLLTVLKSFLLTNPKTKKRYDMVQTSVMMKKTKNGIQQAQDFEFASLNRKQQLLRNRLGNGIASGNGQFVTLRLANEIAWGGGLLEDMEFTIRTWLAGFSVLFVDSACVYQEAVTKYKPYIRQRTRWCTGGIQCAKYLKNIFRSSNISFIQKLEITYSIFFPVVYAFVNIGNIIALGLQFLLILIYQQISLELTIILTVWFLIAVMASVSYHTFKNKHLLLNEKKNTFFVSLKSFLFFQWYAFLSIPIPFISMYQLITGNAHWNKTVHGEEEDGELEHSA